MIQDEKLARHLRRKTARLNGTPAVKAEVTVFFADDSETKLTVYLGKSSAATRDTGGIEKDKNAREKIMAAAPAKGSKPMTMKAIIKAAGLGYNQWNRNKFWDLVEEQKLATLRDGFTKGE